MASKRRQGHGFRPIRATALHGDNVTAETAFPQGKTLGERRQKLGSLTPLISDLLCGFHKVRSVVNVSTFRAFVRYPLRRCAAPRSVSFRLMAVGLGGVVVLAIRVPLFTVKLIGAFLSVWPGYSMRGGPAMNRIISFSLGFGPDSGLGRFRAMVHCLTSKCSPSGRVSGCRCRGSWSSSPQRPSRRATWPRPSTGSNRSEVVRLAVAEGDARGLSRPLDRLREVRLLESAGAGAARVWKARGASKRSRSRDSLDPDRAASIAAGVRQGAARAADPEIAPQQLRAGLQMHAQVIGVSPDDIEDVLVDVIGQMFGEPQSSACRDRSRPSQPRSSGSGDPSLGGREVGCSLLPVWEPDAQALDRTVKVRFSARQLEQLDLAVAEFKMSPAPGSCGSASRRVSPLFVEAVRQRRRAGLVPRGEYQKSGRGWSAARASLGWAAWRSLGRCPAQAWLTRVSCQKWNYFRLVGD